MSTSERAFALLTHSRLRAARSCQRLHHFEFHLGYRPVLDAEQLRFGSLFHRGLEGWWKGLMAGLSGEALVEAAVSAMLKQKDTVDRFDAVRAEWLLRGYHVRWEKEPYEVLSVEVPFEAELRNPTTGAASRTWHLAGKVDAIVRDLRDGRVLVVEHKTSAEDISAGGAYWRRLRMDGQVSIYFEGARSLGHDVAGCLYDVIGKPGLRPLKATAEESRKYTKQGALYANQRAEDESPEQYRERLVEALAAEPERYFQRGEVVRLENEMSEALFDIWQLGQQMREAELVQRFPRNPDACVRFGMQCPFFDVCSGAASLEDPSLFTRSTEVHPELERSKEVTA